MARHILTIVTVVLASLLLVSNGLWLRHSIQTGQSYVDVQFELAATHRTLAQALDLMPVLASGQSEDKILEEAEMLMRSKRMDKPYCVWVDDLGFKFGLDGELIHVATTRHLNKLDPCFSGTDT